MLTLDNATFGQICALGIITEHLDRAITEYQTCLDIARRRMDPAFVYCWADTGLCVRARGGMAASISVVGPEKASEFDRNTHTFKNGQGKKAQWMTWERALLINLNRAQQSLADFYAAVAA